MESLIYTNMTSIKRFSMLRENNEAYEKEASKFEKLSKKVYKELGLNLSITASFGFGVGFFYPIVHSLINNMDTNNVEVTDEMVVLLTICVFSILLKDNKKDIKKLLEEIRMNGTYGIAKKLVKAFECIKDFALIVLKNVGKSIITFIDIFSYTTIFVPFAMALNAVITKNHISLDQFINNFITVGVGTVTIAAKYYIIDLVERLKNYFKLKIDDSKILSFFKTTRDTVIKRFSEYDKDEKLNEMDSESERYLEEVENEVC